MQSNKNTSKATPGRQMFGMKTDRNLKKSDQRFFGFMSVQIRPTCETAGMLSLCLLIVLWERGLTLTVPHSILQGTGDLTMADHGQRALQVDKRFITVTCDLLETPPR